MWPFFSSFPNEHLINWRSIWPVSSRRNSAIVGETRQQQQQQRASQWTRSPWGPTSIRRDTLTHKDTLIHIPSVTQWYTPCIASLFQILFRFSLFKYSLLSSLWFVFRLIVFCFRSFFTSLSEAPCTMDDAKNKKHITSPVRFWECCSSSLRLLFFCMFFSRGPTLFSLSFAAQSGLNDI